MAPGAGARYEITIDGVGRTNRDTREIAFEAANVLKSANPYAKVRCGIARRSCGDPADDPEASAPSRARHVGFREAEVLCSEQFRS
jgi:hypothetical protein